MNSYSGAQGNKTRLQRVQKKENVEETDNKINYTVDKKKQGISEVKDKEQRDKEKKVKKRAG